MLDKIKLWLYYSIMERGQCCSGWFDGWWGQHCAWHDKNYKYPYGKTKIECDWFLFKGVATSGKGLQRLIGWLIGLIMWLGVTCLPFSYKYWRGYRGTK